MVGAESISAKPNGVQTRWHDRTDGRTCSAFKSFNHEGHEEHEGEIQPIPLRVLRG
jgi:hypothetical protein